MPSFDKTHSDQVATHSVDVARQGLEVDASDPQILERAIELAFDYRGDVTVVRHSDPQPLVGYIFDRNKGSTPECSAIRLIPADRDERITIAYSDIVKLSFSGRDTAAGKSFQTWMKKYVRNKLAGREASIHSESLEDDR